MDTKVDTSAAEWIQKCSFVAGGEIEQMDAKVLLMLVVITDLPRASPGHPGRVWVGDGARARWTPFRASRGDAVVPERTHFRGGAQHGRLRSDEMQFKRDVDRANPHLMG